MIVFVNTFIASRLLRTYAVTRGRVRTVCIFSLDEISSKIKASSFVKIKLAHPNSAITPKQTDLIKRQPCADDYVMVSKLSACSLLGAVNVLEINVLFCIRSFQTAQKVIKTKEKAPKSHDFSAFLVEISGIEPLTS